MPRLCRDYLYHFLPFNSILGLPFFVWSDFSTNQARNMFANFYQFLTETLEFLGFLSCLISAPSVVDDIDVLCGCLSSVTHSWQVVSKTFHLKLHRKQFMNHLDLLQNIFERNPSIWLNNKEISFKQFFLKQSRYIRILQRLHVALMLFCTTSYFYPFIYKTIYDFEEGDLLPVVGYFPFDVVKSPNFFVSFFFQVTCFYLYNVKMVVIDYFMMSVIVLHTSQLKFLNEVLKDIVKTKGLPVKESRERLHAWVVQHQRSYRAALALKPLVSGYLIVEYLYAFVHTCIPAFVITSTKSWGITQKIALFMMIFTGLILLFLLAAAGDSLTSVGRSLENTLYDKHVINWRECRMTLYVYSALENKPLLLKFGSMFPLCFTTFLSITRLIFTYYMTLNEIQRMKKGDNL